MTSNNFNTQEMKTAFFDFDEQDREITRLPQGSLAKLLRAIDYGIKRTTNRGINVKLHVLFDTDTFLDSDQSSQVMKRLEAKGATVIMTMEDLVVSKTDEGHIFAIRLSGGCKFQAVKANVDEDDSSTGSGYDAMADMGLTQECKDLIEAKEHLEIL